MPIPDYQTIMLPLLKFIGDGMEHSTREIIDFICKEFNLKEQEKQELLPSGQQAVIDNRVGWARTYMKKAGLLETPQRGQARITKRGLEILNENPNRIDVKFLEQFSEFIEFRKLKKEETEDGADVGDAQTKTPDELMELGYNSINANLEQELLDRIMKNSPAFFERLVSKLLENMDYGDARITGKTGDGGVDGILNQDKLGLDKIYLQAKRFSENTPVTASMLRDFIGALDAKGVTKGVFITTSRFPRDAETILGRSSKSIILMDGVRLVKLMVEFEIGVTAEKVYKIKRIDSDFFSEE